MRDTRSSSSPEPIGSGPIDPGRLRKRLGTLALGAGRDVRAAAELCAGEELRAVATGMEGRRLWVIVATDAGLRLARRPRIGRRRARRLEWRDLTAVATGPQRVKLTFGEDEVRLAMVGPHDEYVRLIETARGHEAGEPKVPVEELRELARRKLGRTLAFGFEGAIDSLPDRLEPGERVERLACATLGFDGLLVLTDRRLLLLGVALRESKERVWAVARDGIRTAEPVEDGLRVQLDGEDPVTLTAFVPPDRRDEFAVVLAS